MKIGSDQRGADQDRGRAGDIGVNADAGRQVAFSGCRPMQRRARVRPVRSLHAWRGSKISVSWDSDQHRGVHPGPVLPAMSAVSPAAASSLSAVGREVMGAGNRN